MKKHTPSVSHGYITLPLIGLGLLSAGTASASITWTGLGTDDNWSTIENWDPNGSPAAQDVVFDDTAKSTDKDIANSVVDTDMTLSSLSFENTGNGDSDWQVVEIGTEETLTLDGSSLTAGNVLFVGSTTATSGQTYSYSKITGGGALVIDATDDDVLLTKISSDHLGKTELDLSGLSSFTADVDNFYVGFGNRTSNTLTLASTGQGTNSITSNKLVIGDSDGSTGSGMNILELGRSTTLNVDSIMVGAPEVFENDGQTASGRMEFQTLTGDTPSVVIRAKDGVGRADLTVAYHDASQQGYQSLTGDVDFTGGTVDALLGDVLIGRHNAYSGSGHTGGATGTLSMDAGTIDASSVVLGQTETRSSSTADPATGILNVSGGTFIAGTMTLGQNLGSNLTDTNSSGRAHGTVNISGTGTVDVTSNLVMGSKTGGSTDVTATVDIAGGTLKVGGNMAENNTELPEITSSVNLHGGTLDMTGGNIVVDTFTLESGILKNLGQFNSGDTTGAALVKTSTGTLNIEGDNTYTGATMINEGIVALITAGTNNIANSSAITVAEGATFDLSGVTGGFTLAAGQALGGDGTIIGDLTLASGALFTFNESDTLAVTGTISFEGFSITDLEGLDSSTIAGTYNLIAGTVDAANISNIGSENAYDLGDGKLAYFEIGSLDLVVVPEPSAFALIMGGSALLLIARRRRR
jgi:autotransporter-associated beta strand protein